MGLGRISHQMQINEIMDEDWYEVVFLRQCPFCGDLLRKSDEGGHALYYHDGQYRGWCKGTNFTNGVFRITKANPWFLNDGYGWGGA
jgi:hypothetical protein